MSSGSKLILDFFKKINLFSPAEYFLPADAISAAAEAGGRARVAYVFVVDTVERLLDAVCSWNCRWRWRCGHHGR